MTTWEITSWSILKSHFIKGMSPGTFGYTRAVIEAADIFMDIRGRLADYRSSITEFDNDPDVLEAYKNSGLVNSIKRMD